MSHTVRQGLFTLVVFLGLGAMYIAHAQLGSTDPINLTIEPSYPRPYQIITVTPDSDLIDLSASTVTFSVNGRVVQTGTGSESASIAVGGPGTVTNIVVTATNNGQKYTKSISIHPADVALIIEPTSTIHPFYEGASLVGSEGRVRIIAIPDLRNSKGVQIPPQNLVYSWKNGDQILQDSSGIGRSVLTAAAPVRYRNATITLTVSSQDSSVVGQASVYIAPADPLMRIYHNDPLLGPLFDTALPNSITLNGSEDTYRAVPYYFTSIPSLTWQMNGTPSQTGQDITVRPAGSGQGTAILDVTGSSGTLGQSANSTMSVTFGKTSTGIFGL
ncbi:MAG: seg [Parcubacteria group bacterium]|nr:seg [Parcubacteria group bacterium]